MTIANRRLLLRANALYLGIAAIASLLLLDLRAVVFGTGPASAILAAAPHAAIGFVEAHGLAFIMAVLLWQAPPNRYAHLTAAAVMSLLGISNLAFWPLFTATGMTAAGVVLTALHLGFALAQAHAARKVELRLA
jgi:hypothetical protein